MKQRIICTVMLTLLMPALGVWAELTPDQKLAAEVLIKQFTARQFAVRQQAVDRLVALGPDVLPMVKKALAETNDNDVKLRCRMVLKSLGARTATPGPKLIEKVVKEFSFTPATNQYWYTTPGGKNIAWSVQHRRAGGEKHVVYHNGVKGPEYEGGGNPYATLSTDGKHVAYVGRRGKTQRIVVDGVEGPEFDEVMQPAFTSNGELVYAAVKDGKWLLIRNGKVSGSYDRIGSGPHLSPDGRHVYYRCRRGEQSFVVIDGVEGPPHKGIEIASQTPKPRYLARDGGETWLFEADFPDEHPDKPNTIVERKLKSFGRYPTGGGSVSRYGGITGVCYVVKRDGKNHVTFNGKAVGTYHDTWFHKVSSDGKRLVFSAKRDNQWFLVIDGVEGPKWDKVLRVVFSQDGSRLGYVAERDGKHYPVVDGKIGPAWARIYSGDFSPGGRHTAFVGKLNGRFYAVIDGRKSPDYDSSVRVRFSEDSRHWFYSAKRFGSKFIVCDGLRSSEYDRAGDARFSPDGRHLFHWAGRDGKVHVVVDGIESEPHDAIRFRSTLDGPWRDRAIRYYTFDDERLKLVEVEWPKGLDWTNGLKKPEKEEQP